MHFPSLVTTTLVGYVPSKASSALNGDDDNSMVYRNNSILNCMQYTYLLYMRTSGFHSLEGGTLMSSMFPYSDLFHFMLISFHS